MRYFIKVIALLLALCILLACSFFSSVSKPTGQAKSTLEIVLQSPMPRSTPTLPSPTAAPMPAVMDTPAPVNPVATLTSAPTGLNPAGPYVIFKAPNGVWLSNPDGSFLTQLSKVESWANLRQAISPKGDRMALIDRDEQGFNLELITIPGGETEKIAHLIDYTPADESNAVSAKSFAVYAIRDYDSLAWQPGEGRLLAFMGATNGPTSDLYVYDTQTKKITQLTNGPSQAVWPAWSPDGQYILHFGVSWVPPFGGAILGANRLDGVWAVDISNGNVITLPRPVGNNPTFVGWQDAAHFITYDSNDQCFSQNLRSINIISGKATAIMPYSFYYRVAQSPENGAFLFASEKGCTNSLGDGVFLLPAGQTKPERLLDKQAYEVDWMPESKFFNAYPEALFSADGQTRYDPPVYDASYHPAISKEGYQAWQVIQNQKGRVVVRLPGGEWQTIATGFVDQLLWDPVNEKTLFIVMDDGTLYTAAFPDFTPQKMGKLDRAVSQAIWTP